MVSAVLSYCVDGCRDGHQPGPLGLAMKELPLGTALQVDLTGVCAVGTVIAGIILFGESMALFRLAMWH